MGAARNAIRLDRIEHTNKLIELRDKTEVDTDYARIIEEALLWNV